MTHKHITVEEVDGDAVFRIESYPTMGPKFRVQEWLTSKRLMALVLVDYALWFGIGFMVAKMI